jgi:hypothetical protein
MIKNSEEQTEINEALRDNSKTQTKILNRQTVIFFFTGVFTLGSFIVSFVSLNSTSERDKLQRQLQEQSKELQSLRRQLLRLKIDSSRVSEAKKIDSKKKT